MIDWSAIEDAVRAWVVAAVAGDLAADAVWFADQSVRAPEASPRIVIRVGDMRHVGGPDAVKSSFDGAAPAGQEVTRTTLGMRELTVGLQAYATKTTGTGVTARSLLAKCQASLGLPSVRATLNAAGLGVLDEGDVRRIPAVRGVTYEDRAFLDTRMCLSQSASEKTGYIARVTGSVTLTEGTTSTTQSYEVD